MLILWSINYVGSDVGQVKRRQLSLNTNSLEPDLKAAVETVVEFQDSGFDPRIHRFRFLFTESDLDGIDRTNDFDEGRTIFSPDYFEDEFGRELSGKSLVEKLTGSADAVLIPPGTTPYQIEYALSQASPVIIDQLTFDTELIEVLSVFCNGLTELMNCQLFKCGPGQLANGTEFRTAVTDDEIRSFVSVYRKLYMTGEPANFSKAVEAFTSGLQGHPVSSLVTGYKEDYEKSLSASPERMPPYFQVPVTFSRKRLLDVFIYTQYAHQPTPERKRQYTRCLAELGGNTQLLSWLFLSEIWKSSLTIANGGQIIRGVFLRYCKFHRIDPNEIRSMASDCPGIGSMEKQEHRKSRIFNEKLSELATKLWHEAGQPSCGPGVHLDEARKRLNDLLD